MGNFDLKKYLSENELLKEDNLDSIFNPNKEITYILTGPLMGITLTIYPLDPKFGVSKAEIEGDTWAHQFNIYLEDDNFFFNGFLDKPENDYDGWSEDESPEQIKKLKLVGTVDFTDNVDGMGEYFVKINKLNLKKYLAENKLNEVDAEEVEYMGASMFFDELHTNMVDFLKSNINSEVRGGFDVNELATDVVDLISNRLK